MSKAPPTVKDLYYFGYRAFRVGTRHYFGRGKSSSSRDLRTRTEGIALFLGLDPERWTSQRQEEDYRREMRKRVRQLFGHRKLLRDKEERGKLSPSDLPYYQGEKYQTLFQLEQMRRKRKGLPLPRYTGDTACLWTETEEDFQRVKYEPTTKISFRRVFNDPKEGPFYHGTLLRDRICDFWESEDGQRLRELPLSDPQREELFFTFADLAWEQFLLDHPIPKVYRC